MVPTKPEDNSKDNNPEKVDVADVAEKGQNLDRVTSLGMRSVRS